MWKMYAIYGLCRNMRRNMRKMWQYAKRGIEIVNFTISLALYQPARWWHQPVLRTAKCRPTFTPANNHASTPPLSFLQAGSPSCHPTNSVKALKAYLSIINYIKRVREWPRVQVRTWEQYRRHQYDLPACCHEASYTMFSVFNITSNTLDQLTPSFNNISLLCSTHVFPFCLYNFQFKAQNNPIQIKCNIVNTSKHCLDKYWSDRDVMHNYKADLHGIGNCNTVI